MDCWGGKVLSFWNQSIWIPRVSIKMFHCTKISMRSMLMLGGSGGMLPRKILKNRCSEIESEAILE